MPGEQTEAPVQPEVVKQAEDLLKQAEVPGPETPPKPKPEPKGCGGYCRGGYRYGVI